MTAAILGQLIGIVLFAVILFDYFYLLPKKIKSAEALPNSEKTPELESLRRQLAAGKRGYWIYVFFVVWVINIIQLIAHLLFRADML